jgi:hypothetical protein
MEAEAFGWFRPLRKDIRILTVVRQQYWTAPAHARTPVRLAILRGCLPKWVMLKLPRLREKRPRGNPRLQKGVQPCWLGPYNTGRRKGSKNKPRPKPPALIELRLLDLTAADADLLSSPPTTEEADELICHLLDIRRQEDRRRRHLRRYQPWRLIGQALRQDRWPQRDPARIAADLLARGSGDDSGLD